MSMTTLLHCPFCGQQPTEYAIEPHTHVLQFAGGKMPDHQGSHVIECACGCGMIEATREAVAAVWNRRPAQAAEPDMVSVKKEDANNYCRILAALGMQEEGDPIAEVQNMLAASVTRDSVTQAVRDYYFALDTRQHGGVAASTALDAIQKALGLNWVQGAEASARAAIAAAKGE